MITDAALRSVAGALLDGPKEILNARQGRQTRKNCPPAGYNGEVNVWSEEEQRIVLPFRLRRKEATMCQYQKLRRAILYQPASGPKEYADYTIQATAAAYDFSDVAFREILKGLASAGFIELKFQGDAHAEVKLQNRQSITFVKRSGTS